MIASALLQLLLVAAPSGPTVEDLGDGRFRITLTYRSGSVERHADAQLQLLRHARRVCSGRGAPQSEGALVVGAGPGRNRLSLTETFACRR